MKPFRYFIAYKPYGVLTQFSDTPEGHPTLKTLGAFPSDVYPVGRLDRDSEGLLLLTNDTRLNQKLLNPTYQHEREYWVQVEGQITPEAIAQLTNGKLEIKVNKKVHVTLPAKAKIIPSPDLPERIPPIRYRKEIPTSWVSLSLVEGKNRQVRKMTAKVGFPTLRLVRVRIEKLTLQNMKIGEVIELSANRLYQVLQIPKNT